MSPPPWKKDIFLGGDDDEQILISHTNKGTHSHVHSACPLHIFMIAEMTRWICIFCWWFWFQLIVQVLELKTIAHLSSWYLIAKMIILMVRCENYRYLILLMAKMIRKMDSWWWCWSTIVHVVKFANGPPAHMFSLSTRFLSWSQVITCYGL